MSAMLHPAARSGRITVAASSPVRMSAVSAMKWTPQKTISIGALAVGARAGELEAVAAGVGELDDLVLLVVVAEDQEPVAELRFRGADHVPERVGIGGRVAVRQGSLQSQHG